MSCSCFVFLLSTFTICSFRPFNTLYCDSIWASIFSNSSFLAVFSFFRASIFSELFVTSDLIFSISDLLVVYIKLDLYSKSHLIFSVSIIFFIFEIASSFLVVSNFAFSMSAFLVSMLAFAFWMSCSILAIISSRDVPLSSNEDTEIFKSVISVFKLSMYVWSSLFSSANCVISAFNSCISLSKFAITCLVPSLETSNFFFSSSISSTWFFNLAIFSSSLVIWLSIMSNSCFLVAYVISISCKFFSSLADSSIVSAIFTECSSFSFSSFLISELSSSNLAFNSSISLLLPNIFTVFWATEPPLIAPDGFITSPSSVTILNE